MDKLRVDKWLWAARFYKTRTLASEEVVRGRVQVNDAEVKPARELKTGDTVTLRQGPVTRTVVVKGLSRHARTGAESRSSCTRKPRTASRRARKRRTRAGSRPNPAHSIENGRPTKRGRRRAR